MATIVGDYYHKQSEIVNFLKESLAGHKYSDVQLDNYELSDISEVVASNPEVFILGAEDRLTPENDVNQKWLTSDLDQQLVEYVANGGKLIAWHSGMSEYPTNSRYIQMLGGHFVSHPSSYHQTTYHVQIPGFDPEEFGFSDEQYFVKMTAEDTETFLSSSSSMGESVSGWFRSYNKGRILCFAPTHTQPGYTSDALKKLFACCFRSLVSGDALVHVAAEI